MRPRLRINVGNLLELVAAGLAVYGVDSLCGWRWAVVAGAALSAAFAELLYDDTVLRVPIPFMRKNAAGLPEASGGVLDRE